MTLTAEQDTTWHQIVADLDRAWTDRIVMEHRIGLDGFRYPEDRNNAWCYLETAQRTINAKRRDLDRLRAQAAVTEQHVEALTAAAGINGDPVLTFLAYIAFGPDAIEPMGERFEVRLLDPEGYTVPGGVETVPADQVEATKAHLLAVNAKVHAEQWKADLAASRANEDTSGWYTYQPFHQGYTVQVTPPLTTRAA